MSFSRRLPVVAVAMVAAVALVVTLLWVCPSDRPDVSGQQLSLGAAASKPDVAPRPHPAPPSSVPTGSSTQPVMPSSTSPPVSSAPPATEPPPAAVPTAEVPPPSSDPADALSFQVGRVSADEVAVFASRGDLEPAWVFPPVTQFGSPFTLLVVRLSGGWAEVVVPVRENGTRGFVPVSSLQLSEVSRKLVVDVAARELRIVDRGVVNDVFPVVVGADGTPTPTGLFFVTDLISLPDSSGPYGPFIVATSGRSEAFDFFNGGEPLFAVHGTNKPELIGSAASNGCVRVENAVVTALISQLALGTPVVVV